MNRLQQIKLKKIIKEEVKTALNVHNNTIYSKVLTNVNSIKIYSEWLLDINRKNTNDSAKKYVQDIRNFLDKIEAILN